MKYLKQIGWTSLCLTVLLGGAAFSQEPAAPAAPAEAAPAPPPAEAAPAAPAEPAPAPPPAEAAPAAPAEPAPAPPPAEAAPAAPAEPAPAPPPAEAAPAAPAEPAPAPPPAEAAPAAPAEPAPAPAPAEAAPAPEPPKPLEDIRQTQIQVWISETNEEGIRDLGVNLNFTRFVRGVEQSGSVQEVRTDVFSPTRQFDPVTLPIPNQTLFNPDGTTPPLRPDEAGTLADGLQTRNGFGLTASVIDPGYGTIDGVFRGIERKADVDLISKPEVLVVNGGTAIIKAGGQIPYQDVQFDKQTPQLSVKWRDIGVSMNLIPTILPNDSVQLNITQLEVTDISRFENSRGVDLPVFSKRSQTGFVQVPSGETLVIGGLSSRVTRETERRVPVIGKLPLLGFPFRGRNSEATITHLLVFVSPTIVDLRNLTKDAQSALQFWQQHGDEWRNTERIQEEIDSLQMERR